MASCLRFAVASLCAMQCLLAEALCGGGARTSVSLDAGWRFHRGDVPAAITPGFDDRNWDLVDVPHDYVVEGQFAEKNPTKADKNDPSWYWLHAFLPAEPAVYRRKLSLSEEMKGRRLWLEFDGVFSRSRYWVNGREIGQQDSGYARTRFDITEAVSIGADNEIVVTVDPRYDGWWYEGGGIYRHVRLVSVHPVHVAPEGLFVRPEISGQIQGAKADSTVRIETAVNNLGHSSASVAITQSIHGPQGEKVAEQSVIYEIGAASCHTASQSIAMPGASLWSPDHPTLYEARTTVTVGGKVMDEVRTRFGIRKATFDSKEGFILNGQKLKLQGVNMHQDHAGVGVAVPDRLFTWKLERLKEVGCNAIRMSHNPVAPVLLDECDRLGFLVIAENRHLGDSSIDQTPKDAKAVAHRDLSSMVLRDRNHPSIILWSLCNEQWIQGSEEAARMAAAMAQRVRELDPTRPITAALNGGFDQVKGMASALDVIGINYNPWVYDAVHTLFPDKPIIASEIASEICTRGVYSTEKWEDYHGDPKRGHVSAYSISAGPAGQTVENAWPPVADRAFIGGGFVWAAFDYKGEPRPFGWPVINCHYGFMDICGFPKDSYWYYKALWSQEPVLHLFPHWNWEGKEGQEISVWVHSNCEEVELFLNGKSLGRKPVKPMQHLEWKVCYSPGLLTAKGLRGGAWIETTRETTGHAKRLRLGADKLEISADRMDLAVLKAEVVDAEGRVVPVASDKIRFIIDGPAKLIGVGNGNPSSHEPDKADTRSAFNGLAQAIIQSTDTEGDITIKAEAPGLESTIVKLRSRRTQRE